MAYLNPKDVPAANLATFYVTLENGKRYKMLNAKNLEATATVSTADVPRLGCMIKGKKPSGLEIKLSFTVYKCTDMFDNIIEQYKKTGILPTFDCQVKNEDKATSIGKENKVYRDCIIDGDVLLSMFDADGEFVEQTIEAYAMDYKVKDKYQEPDYMVNF